MLHKKDIELKLAEYRVRHTGKDPFGPWSDLKRLHESLDPDGQAVLAQVLKEKKEDPFWRDFIDLFERDTSAGVPEVSGVESPDSNIGRV